MSSRVRAARRCPGQHRTGHIRLGTRVVDRVSGSEPGELLGRAHDVVRHPDMPRSIVALFWAEPAEGRPVAAAP